MDMHALYRSMDNVKGPKVFDYRRMVEGVRGRGILGLLDYVSPRAMFDAERVLYRASPEELKTFAIGAKVGQWMYGEAKRLAEGEDGEQLQQHWQLAYDTACDLELEVQRRRYNGAALQPGELEGVQGAKDIDLEKLTRIEKKINDKLKIHLDTIKDRYNKDSILRTSLHLEDKRLKYGILMGLLFSGDGKMTKAVSAYLDTLINLLIKAILEGKI